MMRTSAHGAVRMLLVLLLLLATPTSVKPAISPAPTAPGGSRLGRPRVKVYAYAPHAVGEVVSIGEVGHLAAIIWSAEVDHLNDCIRRQTRLLRGLDDTISMPLQGSGGTRLWPSQQWEVGCMLAARLATDPRYTPLPGTPADLYYLPFPTGWIASRRHSNIFSRHALTNVTMIAEVKAAVAALATAAVLSLVGGTDWRRRNGTDHIIYTRRAELLTELISSTPAGRAMGTATFGCRPIFFLACFPASCARHHARRVVAATSFAFAFALCADWCL